MRRTVAVLIGLSVTGAAPTAADANVSVPCGSASARTVVQGRDSRVYQRAIRNSSRNFQLFACTRGREPTFLDDPRDNVYAFTTPAIAVAGPLVGYAQTSLDDEGTGFETSVLVLDVRTPDEAKRFSPASRSSAAAKVGSLVVRRSGAIAWIACPETESPPIGSRSPTCDRTGALNRVYRLNAGDKRSTLLEKGRAIDPSSLRNRGSAITWTSRGRGRSSTLR
jgi:hypothetical protein